MTLIGRLISWYDEHILKLAVAFILILIPIYPKFPLIDIPNTWVYVRAEDFLIAVIFVLAAVQLLRKKVSLATPLTWPILIYWLIGLVSLIFTIAFFRGAVAFFPHLATLHFLRRIEYMGVFFIAFWSIRHLNTVKDYLTIIVAVFFFVFFYGLGQKFLGLPGFSTNNEELAKGVPVFLEESSRVLSTFAGHYDLAAWLVILIPIFLSLSLAPLFRRTRLTQLGFFATFLASVILLILTVSRISFGAYLLSIAFLLFFQFSWSVKKRLAASFIVFLLSVGFAFTFTDFADRFAKIARINRIEIKIGGMSRTIFQTEKEHRELLPKSDVVPQPRIIIQPEGVTPPREIEESREKLKKRSFEWVHLPVAQAAEGNPGQPAPAPPPAVVFDRSISTRLHAEWPRALHSLWISPVLGTGYSSISLATDNDYLRALGETGFFGFFALMAIFVVIFLKIKDYIISHRPSLNGFVLGASAGILGILANAFLIDVLEASKVAIFFWLMVGILFGTISVLENRPERQK